MLKPAILYKEALISCYAKSSMDKRDQYFTEQYWSWDITNKDSNWDGHQFVSVDNSDNVVGFLAATVDRGCHFLHSLGAIRFLKESKYDILFARDFKEFFYLIFRFYKYNKINWTVVIGSPHEKMYDKFVNKYGGRIVGYKKDNWRLQDGTICDLKMYELMRKDFIGIVGEGE